jgi:hypothetical protein
MFGDKVWIRGFLRRGNHGLYVRLPSRPRARVGICRYNEADMPLSKQAINELKAIYRDEFGADLSDDAAWAMGHRLVRLYTVLTRPPAAESRGFDEVRSQSHLTDGAAAR